MSSANLYDLLGISPTASADEVRRAFRAMARILHPDVNRAPDAATRFAQVTHAYEVLGDPVRRRAYDDRYRVPDGEPARDPQVPRARMERGVLRGADVQASLHVSLREAALGVEARIDVSRREVCAICVGTGAAPGGIAERCPRCHGTGGTRTIGDECSRCQGSGVLGDPPCSNCRGSGRRLGQTTIIVGIPPAVEHDQVLTLKGEGDVGPRNGPRGDLRLRIAIDPDPVLRRSGIDILMELPLSPTDVMDGCAVEVPTLRGPKRLRVPPQVADRTVLRIGGAGIRMPGAWHKGDQFVTVRIVAPEQQRPTGDGA